MTWTWPWKYSKMLTEIIAGWQYHVWLLSVIFGFPFFLTLLCIFDVFKIMIMCQVNEVKRLSKTSCKNAAPPSCNPSLPKVCKHFSTKLAPQTADTPIPWPRSCLPLGSKAAWNCVSGPPARCTAVTPYSLSCSRRGKLRAWLVGERVLLELSRNGRAKNCCGSPSPSGTTICISGLASPSRPWIIFRIDRGLPDHLARGSA